MARSRNIKPGFAKNEILAEMSAHTRLLFIQLPMLADREGRLEDRPKRICAEFFPYEPELSAQVDDMLSLLQSKGFIERYTVKDKSYINIVNFLIHQKPHHKEVKSVIPGPESKEALLLNHGQSKHDSNKEVLGQPNRPDSLNSDSLIPDSFSSDSLNSDSGVQKKQRTEPKNKKYDQKTSWLIAQAVNHHKAAFSLDAATNSPSVQKLFLALVSTPGIDSEQVRLLAYIIQAKESKTPKNDTDRLGYAINMLKDPKFAPADSSFKAAKDLLAKWQGHSGAEKQLADLAPDLSVKENL